MYNVRIIEETGIHVDVNSVYFWGKQKKWSGTFWPLGIDWMIKSVLQTWINVCNTQAAIFQFVGSNSLQSLSDVKKGKVVLQRKKW